MGHAAVAAGEDGGVGRVVQVDAEVVVEAEDDASQGIAGASALDDEVVGRLEHGLCDAAGIDLLARGSVTYEVVVVCEVGAVAGMSGHAVLDDAARDDPLRVEVDALDVAREHRRLGCGRSDSDAHGEDGVAVDGLEVLRGEVDEDVFRVPPGIVGESPAAALHIDEQLGAAVLTGVVSELLLQLGVERIVGPALAEEDGGAVARDLVQGDGEELLVGALAGDVVEGVVGDANGVAVAHLDAVEEFLGVDVAKALAGGVVEVGFGEVVLEACEDVVDGVVVAVEGERTGALEVAADGGVAEVFAVEAPVGGLFYVVEHAVGPLDDSEARGPEALSVVEVVVAGAGVGCAGSLVGIGQTLETMADGRRVEHVSFCAEGRQRVEGDGVIACAFMTRRYEERHEKPHECQAQRLQKCLGNGNFTYGLSHFDNVASLIERELEVGVVGLDLADARTGDVVDVDHLSVGSVDVYGVALNGDGDVLYVVVDDFYGGLSMTRHRDDGGQACNEGKGKYSFRHNRVSAF